MNIERPFFFFGGKGFFCLEKLRALLAGGSPVTPTGDAEAVRRIPGRAYQGQVRIVLE